jgi:hypothetical protein
MVGKARTALSKCANKKIAIMMDTIPRMAEPQPLPMNALTSPTKPMINATEAIKAMM